VTVVCAERPRDVAMRDEQIEVVSVRYVSRFAPHGTFHDEGAPTRLARGDPYAWVGAVTFPIAAVRVARDAFASADALVSHFVIPCAPIAARVRDGRPHLAIAHGTDARLFARMPPFLQRRVLDGCTTLRVTHDALRASLAPTVRDDPRISVGPMGWEVCDVGPREREACRARWLTAKEDVLVVAVARLVHAKGIDVLARAASLLPRSVRVVIVGDGPDRARVESLATGRVDFTGSLDPAARDLLLRCADICVVPSRASDNAPVAMLEAMGAGCAVIASDLPGLRELGGDAVRYVPIDDAPSLARAIDELAANRAMRDALRSLAATRAARWAWPALAAELESALARG
jgi:glycosyltransferase involved in cell wall biosynthesis